MIFQKDFLLTSIENNIVHRINGLYGAVALHIKDFYSYSVLVMLMKQIIEEKKKKFKK